MTATVSTPLVGRVGELAAVGELAEELQAGRGGALVVEGEAGVGKTRLLAELRDSVRGGPIRVVRGAGRELEADLPFAVLARALDLDPSVGDPDRAAIGRMLHGELPEHAEPGQVRYRLVEAILELVERLAEQAPLLVVIDDLHWVDRASLAVLDRLARRIRHAPLGLAAATRPYPQSPQLESLIETVEAGGGGVVSLEPLGDEHAAELASGLVGGEPDTEVREAVAAAGGNPLFITELVRVVGDGDAGAGDGNGNGVPRSLREACRRRLRSLPEDTRAALRVAAVLGASFDLAAFAGVTERPAAEAARILSPAISEGALVEAGDQLAFRHDLLRETIYTGLPRAVRQGLHTDAARWLAEAGYPAGLVATHLLRGSAREDPEALGWLRRAAEEAVIGDPRTAVELLEEALELAGPEHPEREQLQLRLTQTLLWAGDPGRAERRARRLLARRPEPPAEHAARTMLVYALQAQGRLDDSLAELRQAGERSQAAAHERARAWALWAHAWAHTGDHPEGEQIARRALELGEQADDDAAVCLAATALAAMSMFRGERRASLELGRRAVAIARESTTPEVAWAQPGFVLARALSLSDRHDEAQRVAREGLQRAEEEGAARGLPLYYGVLGTSAFRAGDWDEATTQLETAVRLAEELDYRFGRIFHLLYLTRLAVHRDELEQARGVAREAEGERPTVEALNAAFADHAWGVVHRAEGDTEQAAARLADAWERYAPKWAVFNLHLGPALADALTAAGDRARAAEVAEVIEQLAGRWDTPWARGQARRCAALAAADPGLAREAVELLQQGPPHDLASALEEAARLVDPDRAGGDEPVGLLRRAQSIWSSVGARRGERRTRAALRERGVHQGVAGPRGRPDTGWDALTDTEWRVAELVAEGLIYREIGERMYISRRTVETHVSHIFDKLDLSSRAELTAAYLRREGS